MQHRPNDFIALTKNNNIDLGLRPQVDIVILWSVR
jgi:hypothetical protein